MNLLGGFNWLDFVLFFLLIIGLVIGYVQGLVRQVIGLAALYIAAILGAQYYTYPAGAVRYFFPDAPARFTNALGFIIIFFIVTSIINWLALDAYRSAKLRIFPLLDHMGGSLLGLITTFVAIALLLPVLLFAIGEPWPGAESTRVLLRGGLEASRLMLVFDAFKPLMLNAIGPWLPGGLPSIFNL